MAGDTLHPNLARIAAEYDDITRRYQSRQLSGTQATALITKLHARDDFGVIWTIDPQSGEWLRRDMQGQWVADTPPTAGLATPDGYTLAGRPDRFTPDAMIDGYTVSDDPSSRLEGATRRKARQERDEQQTEVVDTRRRNVLVGVLIVVLVVAGVSWRADRADDAVPAPAPGQTELPAPVTPTSERPPPPHAPDEEPAEPGAGS